MDPNQTPTPGPDVTVAAAVNAPAMVTLYSEDGLAVQVRPEDVNAFLIKGFTREEFDVNAKHTEFRFKMDAAKTSVEAFVKDVNANGIINTAAGENFHVAVVAMRDAMQAWQELNYEIGQRFGVKQEAQ